MAVDFDDKMVNIAQTENFFPVPVKIDALLVNFTGCLATVFRNDMHSGIGMYACGW